MPSAALYLSFSFQHVKTSNCFIHLLIHFLQCSASPQCTLLLPTCCTAALDVFLAILWRICASLRAFKTSKTPPAQAWALRTISKAAVLPVCAFPGFGSRLALQGPAPASLTNVRAFLTEGREGSSGLLHGLLPTYLQHVSD